MQEELSRFTGLWWSPGEEKSLLYEQVDERDVCEIQFSRPGQPPSSPMRYPLAGTSNAVSYLRMISVKGTETNFQVGYFIFYMLIVALVITQKIIR